MHTIKESISEFEKKEPTCQCGEKWVYTGNYIVEDMALIAYDMVAFCKKCEKGKLVPYIHDENDT